MNCVAKIDKQDDSTQKGEGVREKSKADKFRVVVEF